MANEKSSFAQDFTRTVNLTLRPGRVMVLALGLLIGVAIAIFLFWLGGLIASVGKREGLLWLSWIIQRVGALLFAYIVLASMCSAVAMAHSESSEQKMGVPAGWALIARNIGPVALATLKPIIVFVALIAIIWLIGLIGLIPEVGPIIWSIVSIVPIAAGLLATFVVVKLFFVSFLFPAILCTNQEKGVATYKEAVRIIKGHAAAFLGRIAVTILVCAVFYQILLAGFSLTAGHSSRTMGKNAATLCGSALFDYASGIPGLAGTAPSGFAAKNPASPFVAKGVQTLQNYLMFRPRATQRVGGWIFSIIFIVAASVLFSLPLLFFAISGYYTFLALKEEPEMPLRTEAVDWSAIKETAQEITKKRKSGSPEKPSGKTPA